jgi:hypothetical protein
MINKVNLIQEESDLLLMYGIIPKNNNRTLIITLTNEESDLLRDKCGELLQEIGFDADYNLTQQGIILENIIDKLI